MSTLDEGPLRRKVLLRSLREATLYPQHDPTTPNHSFGRFCDVNVRASKPHNKQYSSETIYRKQDDNSTQNRENTSNHTVQNHCHYTDNETTAAAAATHKHTYNVKRDEKRNPKDEMENTSQQDISDTRRRHQDFENKQKMFSDVSCRKKRRDKTLTTIQKKSKYMLSSVYNTPIWISVAGGLATATLLRLFHSPIVTTRHIVQGKRDPSYRTHILLFMIVIIVVTLIIYNIPQLLNRVSKLREKIRNNNSGGDDGVDRGPNVLSLSPSHNSRHDNESEHDSVVNKQNNFNSISREESKRRVHFKV